MRAVSSSLYAINVVSAVLSERPVRSFARGVARYATLNPETSKRRRWGEADPHPFPDAAVTIRRARTADIPQIQRCNRASLPENYNDGFYARHLADWGQLAYVAEAESEVAGYVLGRINERGSELPAPPGSRARTGGECDGHVTSLAVHARHRRRGVARGLMAAVHKAMAPDVATARLHVRCSNAQALQLYAGLGYDVIDVVQGYYHDGEAAYLMAANVRKLAAEEEAREAAVGLVA
mmetsp:Transcript_23165/g.72480  ORF Transcript_23165/g.72480 Transcript_23165/m.72480 type:complete len:237 (-) Transcript_23165:33-743(-)